LCEKGEGGGRGGGRGGSRGGDWRGGGEDGDVISLDGWIRQGCFQEQALNRR
jgi:hypothetical protein